MFSDGDGGCYCAGMSQQTFAEIDMNPVVQTSLPWPDRRQGKVRDIYRLTAGAGAVPRVLIIATDRISAFDVVLPTPVPGKGRVLTDISVRWFELIRDANITEHHLLSTDPADLVELSESQRELIAGRCMIGRAAKVIPVEFVVRGYLAGSGWKQYQESGTVCGAQLPTGLTQCDRLPSPIFTPATKAEQGHDENIDFETACGIAGRDMMKRLRDVSIALYEFGARHAEQHGVILADTKFEFGYALDERGKTTDEVLLIDEALTPDSSRYWPAEHYKPGRDQDSFDKQYVRNFLLTLVERGQWDKTPPGPELPKEVVRNTIARYVEARDRLFGESR